MLQPVTLSLSSLVNPVRSGGSPMATTSDFALALADLTGVVVPNVDTPAAGAIGTTPERRALAAPGNVLPVEGPPSGAVGVTTKSVAAPAMAITPPAARQSFLMTAGTLPAPSGAVVVAATADPVVEGASQTPGDRLEKQASTVKAAAATFDCETNEAAKKAPAASLANPERAVTISVKPAGLRQPEALPVIAIVRPAAAATDPATNAPIRPPAVIDYVTTMQPDQSTATPAAETALPTVTATPKRRSRATATTMPIADTSVAARPMSPPAGSSIERGSSDDAADSERRSDAPAIAVADVPSPPETVAMAAAPFLTIPTVTAPPLTAPVVVSMPMRAAISAVVTTQSQVPASVTLTPMQPVSSDANASAASRRIDIDPVASASASDDVSASTHETSIVRSAPSREPVERHGGTTVASLLTQPASLLTGSGAPRATALPRIAITLSSIETTASSNTSVETSPSAAHAASAADTAGVSADPASAIAPHTVRVPRSPDVAPPTAFQAQEPIQVAAADSSKVAPVRPAANRDSVASPPMPAALHRLFAASAASVPIAPSTGTAPISPAAAAERQAMPTAGRDPVTEPATLVSSADVAPVVGSGTTSATSTQPAPRPEAGSDTARPAARPDVPTVALPVTPPPVPEVWPAARMFAQAMFAAPSIAADPEDTARDDFAAAFLTPAGHTGAALSATLPVAAPHAADRSALDMSRGEWMTSMIDRIETLRDESGAIGETRLKLAPDALGNLDVTVRRDDAGQYQVRINADTAQARTILADAAPRLTDMAEARGLKLSHAGVDTGTGANPGFADSNRRDAQQAPSVPRRPVSAANDAGGLIETTSDTRIA